jgi:rhodanese-related sulfurtransferase
MSIRRIGPEEARALVESGADLVDVREPSEWAQGRIPGARHVPLGDVMRDPERHLPRDRIVFVCARGVRSLAAATAAARIGRTEVYSMDGGTAEWAALGLPLVR